MVITWSLLQSFVSADDSIIGNVSVRFCNEGDAKKELNLIADTNKDYNICMEFYNTNSKPIKIKYGFVDGTLTNDELQKKACTTDITKDFGQYVTQDNEMVTIPANGSIKENASVNFPAWMNGMVNGCLIYTPVDEKTEQENKGNNNAATFDIIVRKASFINALVWGQVIRNIETKEWFRTESNNILSIFIPVYNEGNIEENVTFEGELSNIFGYKHEIKETKKISSNSSYVLSSEINDLPRYKCFFTLKGTVSSEWAVEFNTDLASQDLTTKEIPVEMTIFIIPRLLILIIVGMIILILTGNYLRKHITFHKEEIN